jgi:hypothetical protein
MGADNQPNIVSGAAASTRPARPEPFLTPKELAWKAEEVGASISVDYVRAMLKQMPLMQAPRGRMARWSDFWTFYCLNPDLMPFSRDPAKRTLGRTRGLGDGMRRGA